MKQVEQTRRRSLKSKIIFGITVGILLSLLTTTFIVSQSATKNFEGYMMNENDNKSKIVAKQLESQLRTYEVSIHKSGQEIVKYGLSEEILKRALEENEGVTLTYFIDSKSGETLFYPHVEYDEDGRESNAYKSYQGQEGVYWLDAYQDILSNKIMTTVAVPVIKNGEMLGLLGYDVNLDSLNSIRKEIEQTMDNQLIVLDKDGVAITSFLSKGNGKSYFLNNKKDVEFIEHEDKKQFQWSDDIFNGKFDKLSFHYQDVEYIGNATKSEKFDWYIVSFQDVKTVKENKTQIIFVSLIGIVGGLIIGVVLAIYISNRITRQIVAIREAIKKTSNGDFTSQLEIHTKDEIEELANDFNLMVDQMGKLVKDVKTNVELTKESAVGLRTISEENSQSISEIALVVEEIAQGSANQSNEMDRGTRSVMELGEEIEELSALSKTMEENANQASIQLVHENESIEQLKQAYEKVEESFKKVADMVQSLNEKSKEISYVTNVISEIAEQTNLLSLNASIEAARAGEHGRGFSVVASEVKKLAEQSKESANNIRSIIESVAKDTLNTVQMITTVEQDNQIQKEAVDAVSNSMRVMSHSVEQIIQSLEEGLGSIEKIRTKKEDVVSMIEGLSAVSQQTTASTEEMATVIEEQSASANEVSNYAKKLSQQMEQIDEEMQRFKVKE